MKTKLFAIALLLFFFTLSVHAQNTTNTGAVTLPDIDVYDINGMHTTLHTLAKNKVLVIDCWFIPCPPCYIALGALKRITAQYITNNNVCFITICMTDSSLVKKFIRQDSTMPLAVNSYQFLSNEQQFRLPVYFIPGCRATIPLNATVLHQSFDDISKCAGPIFGFQSYPTCMVFDKHGKQVYKETGFDVENKYAQRLTKVIDESLADN